MGESVAPPAPDRLGSWLRRVGIVTSIAMFIVVTQGDLVTNAGAAQGCGHSWPLCNGKLVPTFTLETLIEFSHRFVVGIVSIGVLFLAIGSIKRSPHRREVQILAPALVFFLILQSVLGGLAVLIPQSAPVLALHMGISLMSLGTVVLSTALLLEEGDADVLRDTPVGAGFRALAFGAFVFLYVLVYIGAFVRHSQAELGCAGWPLCSGRLLPSMTELAIVNYVHRIAALLGLGTFFILWRRSRALRATRPDIYRGSTAAFHSLVIQAASGALVAWSGAALWAELLHGALIALAFAALSYVCYRTLPRPASVRRTPSPRTAPSAPAVRSPLSGT